MKVIVVGAGEVGYYLSEVMSQEKFDITVIDLDPESAAKVDEELDVHVMIGNGSSAAMLNKAGVSTADFVISVTSDDLTNLVCCSLTKALNDRAITIARIHDATYADHTLVNYQLHFGIDHLLNPEALCAVEIAKEIRNPGRVAIENFARGKIEVQQVNVSKSAKITDKPLKEITLPSEVRIASVIREGKLEVATANTVILPDDKVTLFGLADQIGKVKTMLDPASSMDQVRVVLFGGSDIAISLIRLLNNPRFKIRVLEKDSTICKDLAARFPNVTIIRGDATSRRLLEEEQIGSSDYFVACTKRDEYNVMTGIQASKLGVKHVQIVINKPDYEPLLNNMQDTLGVELLVSPRLATANELLRLISTKPSLELAHIPDSDAKIIQIRVSNRSAAVGKRLKDIQRPDNTIVISILHKYNARVPTADDVILAGDRIVALTDDEHEADLVDIFA